MSDFLHDHPNDGSFRQDCQRCKLEHGAVKPLAALGSVQVTLAWGQSRNVTKERIRRALADQHAEVTTLLDDFAPVIDGKRGIPGFDL